VAEQTAASDDGAFCHFHQNTVDFARSFCELLMAILVAAKSIVVLVIRRQDVVSARSIPRSWGWVRLVFSIPDRVSPHDYCHEREYGSGQEECLKEGCERTGVSLSRPRST